MKKDKKREAGKESKKRNALSASFITGAIALVFLIVGWQFAMFMNRAAQARAEAKEAAKVEAMEAATQEAAEDLEEEYGTENSHNSSDNQSSGKSSNNGSYNSGKSGKGSRSENLSSGNSNGVSGRSRGGGNSTSGNFGGGTSATKNSGGASGKSAAAKRTVENFRFDPNTVTVEELQRLGFSEKQAQSIENYRIKGGKFRRKSDFARSFVVSDSIYQRLEPYIDIPLIDLNTADSAEFVTLPGIGGYFAKKMVEYREQLGGYSHKEQLMEIYRFDEEKFDGLEDLVTINPATTTPYPLWTLPEDSLSLHPYIGTYSAHGIVIYREHNDMKDWTIEGLEEAGILRPGMAEKLSLCLIANNF